MASIISAQTSGGGGISMTGDASGILQLQSAGTATVTVDASGNVGIATASPSAKLTVNGFVLSGGQNYSAKFSDAVNSTYSITHQSGLTNLITDTGMAFYTSNAERMRIDSSGNVLIGATSTVLTAKSLLVANLDLVNGFIVKDTGTTGGAFCVFANSADAVAGSITHNASTTTAFNTSSDYRLKDKVAPMVGALEKVFKLKPVTYTWKNTDGEQGEGFIAHELQEVCPIAVTGKKDALDAEGNPKYQGIDTSFLVATLTAAIQEQQALITQLQADVATLKGLSA
jgi:hypothetical protein